MGSTIRVSSLLLLILVVFACDEGQEMLKPALTADIDQEEPPVLAIYQFDGVELGRLTIQTELVDYGLPETIDGKTVFRHKREVEGAEAEIVEDGKKGKGLKVVHTGCFQHETEIEIPTGFTIVAWIKMEMTRFRGYYISIEATGKQGDKIKRIRMKLSWLTTVPLWLDGAIIDVETEKFQFISTQPRLLNSDLQQDKWIHIALSSEDGNMLLFANSHAFSPRRQTEPVTFYPPHLEWARLPHPEYRGIKIGYAGEEYNEPVPNSTTHIDEVGFFSVAMDAAEIKAIYENGLDPFLQRSVHNTSNITTTWGDLTQQ